MSKIHYINCSVCFQWGRLPNWPVFQPPRLSAWSLSCEHIHGRVQEGGCSKYLNLGGPSTVVSHVWCRDVIFTCARSVEAFVILFNPIANDISEFLIFRLSPQNNKAHRPEKTIPISFYANAIERCSRNVNFNTFPWGVPPEKSGEIQTGGPILLPGTINGVELHSQWRLARGVSLWMIGGVSLWSMGGVSVVLCTIMEQFDVADIVEILQYFPTFSVLQLKSTLRQHTYDLIWPDESWCHLASHSVYSCSIDD